MRIHAAEDDPDKARLLENILRKKHTVEVVPDGAKTLQHLRDEKFDALLIDDWIMPKMDGITLI
jgi:DNA-binding response OmpR family regulator